MKESAAGVMPPRDKVVYCERQMEEEEHDWSGVMVGDNDEEEPVD